MKVGFYYTHCDNNQFHCLRTIKKIHVGEILYATHVIIYIRSERYYCYNVLLDLE